MMIVDDEPLVRLALQHMIDWDSMGIQVAFEARDGLEALTILEQHGNVDLLLLDIEMPRLNGIELLRAYAAIIQKRRPVTIMLSAYSDYSYVREAFLLGAMDFIVKSDMDEEHLVPVVLKAVNELRQREMPSPSVSEYRESEIDRKSETLQQLISINPAQEEERYTSLGSGIVEWLTESNQLVAVITISQGSPAAAKMERSLKDVQTQRFIMQSVQTVLDAMSICHLIYGKSQSEYVLFCTLAQVRSENVIREKIQAAFSMIQSRLNQYVNVSISIGISDLASGMKHWYRLYQQAAHLASMSYFAGYNKIFYPESCMEQGRYGVDSGLEHARKLQVTLKANGTSIAQLLEQNHVELWTKEFEQMQLLLGQTWGWRPQDVHAAFEDLLWELGGLLYRKGIRWDDLDEELQHPFEYMKSLETLEETKTWLYRICCQLFQHIHGMAKTEVNYSSVVSMAKQFLDLHYTEDINLTLISEMVGVSESYLSKQFTKEVGCNFIQYLTNLRIEESKRLMKKRGNKITDIAETVGYLNVEHFSRIFKKATGYSPKLYRESLMNG